MCHLSRGNRVSKLWTLDFDFRKMYGGARRAASGSGARKTPEMDSSRCVDTPTYLVFYSTPSHRKVTAVQSALGRMKILPKVQNGDCKVRLRLESPGLGARSAGYILTKFLDGALRVGL